MTYCLSCGSPNIIDVLHINDAPLNIQRLLSEDELAKDNKIDLTLCQCSSCNLFQLGDLAVVPEEYYDDYIMTTSFSEQIRSYIDGLAEEFVDTFKLRNKVIYEIGCGDGIFCEYLEKHGAKTIGVEPSLTFAKFAKQKGLTVIEDYFDKQLPIDAGSVDAIVSRAVFEHLKHPNEVLQATHHFLKEGGVSLIEVPSFEKALSHHRYYDIFSDHVAYYTKESLSHLVLRNGFEIIDVKDTYNDEFIVIVFKKKKKLDVKTFVDEFEPYLNDFTTNIQQFKDANKKICMWGSGGKGLALLSCTNMTPNEIDCVIDSDTNKIGKYTIGSHIPIYSPDYLKTNDFDVLILSAMAYEQEILSYLRQIGFKGDVYVISPMLRKVEL